jgi:hypothetical protein
LEDKTGRRNRKAPSCHSRRGFFYQRGGKPVDMDCDMDDADMGMAIMKSLKIMMKNHGKS